MIFSIAYCGRIWHLQSGKQAILLLVFTAVVIGFAVWDNTAAGWLNASDALVTVGLGTALFVLIIKHRIDINLALSLIMLYVVGYAFLRSWLFAAHLKVISIQMAPMYEIYLKRLPNFKITREMITALQNMITTYQPAIFGSFQVSGVFFGLLLFNNASTLKHPVRFTRLPFVTIYLLIAAVAMCLYPLTKTWGLNLLICMGMVYLVQGTAILSFFWGDFFAKAKMLRTLFIMAIILNYPMLILIAFIGVLDVWFDFRKLTIKEIKA
jgi:hypothetical protein